MDPYANPNCRYCRGQGWYMTSILEKDPCECITERITMGKPLASYPSQSKPGKEYTVFLPNDGGDPYCDCWQWKRNRHCKHLEMYNLNNKFNPPHALTTPESSFDAEINNAVENIINKSR